MGGRHLAHVNKGEGYVCVRGHRTAKSNGKREKKGGLYIMIVDHFIYVLCCVRHPHHPHIPTTMNPTTR